MCGLEVSAPFNCWSHPRAQPTCSKQSGSHRMPAASPRGWPEEKALPGETGKRQPISALTAVSKLSLVSAESTGTKQRGFCPAAPALALPDNLPESTPSSVLRTTSRPAAGTAGAESRARPVLTPREMQRCFLTLCQMQNYIPNYKSFAEIFSFFLFLFFNATHFHLTWLSVN